jgi:hypothetical protein
VYVKQYFLVVVTGGEAELVSESVQHRDNHTFPVLGGWSSTPRAGHLSQEVKVPSSQEFGSAARAPRP